MLQTLIYLLTYLMKCLFYIKNYFHITMEDFHEKINAMVSWGCCCIRTLQQ